MSGIDLIPSGWRESRRLRGELRRWALGMLLVAMTIAGARSWLWLTLDRLRPEVADLRQAQAHASAEHAEALRYVDRLHALQLQQQALERLHVGHSVGLIDAALQASLNDDVWLQEVSYVRGERMVVRGSALRHEALAGFVSTLAQQPGFSDVRVIGTTAGEGYGRTLVMFELAAELELRPTTPSSPAPGPDTTTNAPVSAGGAAL